MCPDYTVITAGQQERILLTWPAQMTTPMKSVWALESTIRTTTRVPGQWLVQSGVANYFIGRPLRHVLCSGYSICFQCNNKTKPDTVVVCQGSCGQHGFYMWKSNNPRRKKNRDVSYVWFLMFDAFSRHRRKKGAKYVYSVAQSVQRDMANELVSSTWLRAQILIFHTTPPPILWVLSSSHSPLIWSYRIGKLACQRIVVRNYCPSRISCHFSIFQQSQKFGKSTCQRWIVDKNHYPLRIAIPF